MASGSRALTAVFILIALALFVVRGPIRFSQHPPDEPTDLLGPYLGAQAWLRGLNPYAPDVHWDLKAEAGWRVTKGDRVDGFAPRTAYPLTALILLAPFALLSWPSASVATTLCMTTLGLLAIAALSSIPDLRSLQRSRAVFVMLALVLAPLQSGIGAGNLAAAAAALTAIAAWGTLTRRDTLAGVALAFAICLKPPLGLPLLGYSLIRHWRVAVLTVLMVAAIGGLGMLRLYVAGTSWFADYWQNNQLLVGDRGIAMIEHSGAQRQFINLQYLGYELFGNAQYASLLAISVGAVLVLVWLALVVRREGDRSELLAMSSIAVISLLPIYHRAYDAGLLLLPLCWILAETSRGATWLPRVTLVLMLPFFIPAATFIDMQVDAGRVPAWLSARWWWNTLVLPHQVWCLLGIAIALLSAQALNRRARPAAR